MAPPDSLARLGSGGFGYATSIYRDIEIFTGQDGRKLPSQAWRGHLKSACYAGLDFDAMFRNAMR
jgi:hypothetical protein